MKLYYYDNFWGAHNFGDLLNDWLWRQLIPDVLDDEERVAFIGLGTLLNERLPGETPNACRRVIFSTGAGYQTVPLAIDESYAVYCVRGPLSAQMLGLPEEAAVTDGALLVRRCWPTPTEKRHRFSYMPHIEQLAAKSWQTVCEEAGGQYIDPRSPIETVLSTIAASEIVFAEAMHAAIVADALGVPWVPVVTTPNILAFKWEDWCQTIGVPYHPVSMISLGDPRAERDLLTPLRDTRQRLRRGVAVRQFRDLLRGAKPQLSREATRERLTQNLEERLERLRGDVRNGRFAVAD